MILSDVQKLGYVQADVDPTINLVPEIQRLKLEMNAVILAHYYQESEIQEIADFVGDSLALAQYAAKTPAEVIVFAGVHFMAETAKILNPDKLVLLPDLKAGCSLSDSCPAPVFAEFKKKHPDHLVISYINCSAGLKALTDIIVTSSNALHIVNSLPKDQPIIFAPDKNLGAYIRQQTGRDMLLWDGACMVHEVFSRRKIQALMDEYPEAEVICHPECEAPVLELAHYIGSTSGLLRHVQTSPAQSFIVVTETGILHEMRKSAPHKKLIPGPANHACACNNCPHMKLNTLEKLYNCMLYRAPEISMDPELMQKARLPIDRMLELSRSLK